MCIALLPLTEILLKTVKALVSRHPQNVKKLSVNAAGHLCISQFHLRPAPPPSWVTAGHLPALSVPGVGHLQMLHCPWAGYLPTPGPFLSFWHAHGFLSEYNYKEGFTGRKADWLICQGQEQIVEGCNGMFSILHVCMHFFIAYQARIT